MFDQHKLLQRLDDFPAPKPLPRGLAGWLLVARIETLETLGSTSHSNRIEGLYRELSAFDSQQLANYPLVKLARWLNSRGETAAAVKRYDAVLARPPEQGYADYALLDLGLMEAASESAADRQRALERLETVLEGYQTPELAEAATLGIARLHMQAGQWEEAFPRWSEYLSHRNWTSARAEANYQLAVCLDHAGKTAEALKSYISTYVNFEGHVDWSARAYLRSAIIQKERGDAERALLVLDDMLKRLGHIDNPVIGRARTLKTEWEAAAATSSPSTPGTEVP